VPPQQTFLDPLQQAKNLIRPALPKSKFPVFVFGPFLKPETKVEHPNCSLDTAEGFIKHARYLRYRTASALKNDGFPVHFGETEEVQKFWRDQITSLLDPANVEMEHAERFCGAVVVFPSSVGSFCELSLFATRKSLATKTIALIHKAHENDDSFFRRGLLRILRQGLGTHEFKDYTKVDECVNAACEFVTDRYLGEVRSGNMLKLGVLSIRELEQPGIV
jgi:hypothetical protein